MLYTQCADDIEKLKELLVFQERRNFFNKIEDKHLITSIGILDAILLKTKNHDFSNADLCEVIQITSQILSTLNLSEEALEHIKVMKKSAEKLKDN